MVPRTLNASATVFLPSTSLSSERERLTKSEQNTAEDSCSENGSRIFPKKRQLPRGGKIGLKKSDAVSGFDRGNDLVYIDDPNIDVKRSNKGNRFRDKLNGRKAKISLGAQSAYPAAHQKSHNRSNRGRGSDALSVENHGTDCQAIEDEKKLLNCRTQRGHRLEKRNVSSVQGSPDLRITCKVDDGHQVQVGIRSSQSMGPRSADQRLILRDCRIDSKRTRHHKVHSEELESFCAPVRSNAETETAQKQKQNDEYPHLPNFRNYCSKISSITKPISSDQIAIAGVDSSALSYLAISSRCLKDVPARIAETADDLTSTMDNTGWYFGNALTSKQLSIPSLLGSAELDCPAGFRGVHLSSGDTNEKQSGSNLTKNCDLDKGDTACIEESPTELSRLGLSNKNELAQKRCSDAYSRSMIIQSGSKTAAERWKSRWLEIARQQSALQRDLIKSPSLSRAAGGKDWHSALSQGSVKTARCSFLYSADRFASTDKQPHSAATAATGPASRSPLTAHGRSLYSTFRWWSAMRVGDYATVLGMIASEKIKLDTCFCYHSYLADSHSICSMQKDKAGGQTLTGGNMTDSDSLVWEVCLKYARLISSPEADRPEGDENHRYSQEDQGLHAVHICAKFCHPVLLEHLLRSNSMGCVDSRERTHKLTALHIACQMGHLECARILLLNGADPDCRDKQGDTALHKSCSSTGCSASQIALVAFLCERGKSNSSLNGKSLKVNTKNKRRKTALMFVRTRELVVILIGAGADPHLVSYGGLDAACMAAGRGDSKVLEAILSCNSFRKAPTSSTVGLFSSNAPPTSLLSVQESSFTTPLHEAAKVGSVACTRVLLGARYNGTDLNCANRPGGSTPLMLACDGGHSKVVQELLDKGADTEAEDRRAVTAMVIATRTGHLSCVRAIIAVRPQCLTKKNSIGENILEMYARILRQDLSAQCPSDQVIPLESSIHASQMHDHSVEQSLPCLTDLIMHGAVVTERFVRRFSSFHTLDLLKLMRISRLGPMLDNNGRSGLSKCTGRTLFEADVAETMWQVPAPSSSFCDVTFQLADGESCLAHSFIVSSCSASLEAMLRSSMLARIDSEDGTFMRAVSLPYHSKATFLLSLEWMYTLNDVTDALDLTYSDDRALLLDLLYQSNELLMTPLQHLCEHAIGRHLDLFDKNSALTIGLNLNLQLLLTYYWKRYPPDKSHRPGVEDLTSSEVRWDAKINKDREQLRDPADDAVAESCYGEPLKGNRRGDMRSANIREDFMRGAAVEDFITVSSEEDWNCWLAGSSLLLASASPSLVPMSEHLDNQGTAHRCRALDVDQRLAEDCFASWWYRCLVGMAVKQSPSPYKLDLNTEQAEAVLLETYPFLFKHCTSVTQKCGEGERKAITDESSCFDYTCSPPPQPTVDSTMPRLLSPHNPDASIRAMLTDLRTCAVSVDLLQNAVSPSADEGPREDVASSVNAALDAVRTGLLESEPFFCLNTSQHFLVDLSTAEKERASLRLRDITPSCVLLQQQRAALLRSTESSNFDTLIVISYSIFDDGPDSNSASSEGTEYWDTTNNCKYIPSLARTLRQEEQREIALVIPAHRALLSAGSGKLAAMIRFASLQGPSYESVDCGGERPALLLEVSASNRQEDLGDFKDLVWFMYTGVLREPSPRLHASAMATRLLRLLWLADQYLMPALSRLLEYRMLRDLCPESASMYFMAAHSMQMKSLELAAGLSVLYAPHDTHYGNDEVEVSGDGSEEEDSDCDNSTALVLVDVLRTLSISPHQYS